jgi:hypothetical protein
MTPCSAASVSPKLTPTRTLTRPGVIRYFLQRTWGSKAIDEDLWRYAVVTTRQPGARNAPFRFFIAHQKGAVPAIQLGGVFADRGLATR